jgi:zinc protease
MGHPFELVERKDAVAEWRHRGNGLRVLVCPTPVAPVVSFGVVYGVGSRHEGAGQTGATHILEHLMFKGSRRFNAEEGTEIARVLQRVGARFNASTWLDRTNYYETLPVEHLPLAVDIEADRMRHARVRDADLASERTVVLNELERGENEPFDLLLKESFAHAFLEHPYHHPTIGWRSDVEHISGAVLRSYYDTYYHPDNATVMVVGDVTEQQALDEVERGFGEIPPAPAPIPRVHAREGRQRGLRRFDIHRAAEVGGLALSWHIPEGLHPDLPALSVLAQILAEGVTSRLQQRLVETNRCLGVHAFAWELHDPGLFQVFATPAPGVPHDEVEAAIREEVAALAATAPGAAELARAKAQVRTDIAFHRESPAQIVAALTESVAMGDWRRVLREMELVSAVDAGDVTRVAAEHLRDLGLTVGWFVAENGDAGAGAAAPGPPRPRPCFLHAPFAERVLVRPLEGGARAAVLANPHAPTVTIAGTLRAGPACVADGRFGVAGMTAAMLERGTLRHDRLGLATELEGHGLQLGVEASASAPTVVSFSAQGLAEELPRLVGLLAEVLRDPTFPADELDKLREQVLGGLQRERQETHPTAYGALTRHLYPEGHPLRRRPVDERIAEVRSLGRDELEAFHRAAYGPAALVLAVVGDVDPERVLGLLGEHLEGWRGGLAEPVDVSGEVEHGPAEERVFIADRPNVDVFLGHAGRLHRGDEDYPAAILANSCLGQSTLTSRLGLAVRDRAGLTYGIYSRFFGTLGLAGPWATLLGVAPENLDRAVALCREVISEYVAGGPAEDELADERSAMSGGYRVGLATNAGIARELVTALTSGQEVSHLDRYADRLAAVGLDEVRDAIRRHLHPERLVVVAAGSVG